MNKENPLGTGGELSTCYAKMIRSLWYGTDASFSPTQFKRAIGKYQPMFSGYNQHDSGELITFLLDGLHEDLNRIKKKPYVETKDYDGRPDKIIAKESWENFLLRNKSEIVDLMYGQYRSVVDCPQCKYRSIQFDPFLMCQLPITNTSNKKIEMKFVHKHFYQVPITVVYEKSWNWTMKDVFGQIIH
jgi:ubiquitin carboxyl-terminal hydrolase 4/11